MKKISVLIMLFCTMGLLSSCQNIGQKKENNREEKTNDTCYFYTYDYIYKEISGRNKIVIVSKDYEGQEIADFVGIAVKKACWIDDENDIIWGQSLQENYIKFDDEVNYDSEIYEWRLAYYIAEDLFDWNKRLIKGELFKYEYKYSFSILAHLLMEVPNLPNNVDGNMEEEPLEIFKKNYYNLKDSPIYPATNGYGIREYPIGYYKSGKPSFLYLIRAKDIEGIPNGTLIITRLPSYFGYFR